MIDLRVEVGLVLHPMLRDVVSARVIGRADSFRLILLLLREQLLLTVALLPNSNEVLLDTIALPHLGLLLLLLLMKMMIDQRTTFSIFKLEVNKAITTGEQHIILIS